jgi:hypothetical protein
LVAFFLMFFLIGFSIICFFSVSDTSIYKYNNINISMFIFILLVTMIEPYYFIKIL